MVAPAATPSSWKGTTSVPNRHSTLRIGRTNWNSLDPQRMALGTCRAVTRRGRISASRSTVGRPGRVRVTTAQGSFLPGGCSNRTWWNGTPHFSANLAPVWVGRPSPSTHRRWGGPTWVSDWSAWAAGRRLIRQASLRGE